MAESTPGQSPQRPRFKSTQDWNQFIGSQQQNLTGDYLLQLRTQCYTEIEALRKRPLLVYASRFLNAPKVLLFQ